MAPPSDTSGAHVGEGGGGLSEAERLAVEASAAAAAAEAAAGIEAANEAARAAEAAAAEAAAQRSEFVTAIEELRNWLADLLAGHRADLQATHEAQLIAVQNLMTEQSQALGSLILALPRATAETVVEELEEEVEEEVEEAPITDQGQRPNESDPPREPPENERQAQEDTPPPKRNRPRF